MASGVVLCRVVRITSRENFLLLKFGNKLTRIHHEIFDKTLATEYTCDLT